MALGRTDPGDGRGAALRAARPGGAPSRQARTILQRPPKRSENPAAIVAVLTVALVVVLGWTTFLAWATLHLALTAVRWIGA